MCRHGMTSYIGAAWRLKRAAMSISTMGGHRPCRIGLRDLPGTGGQAFFGKIIPLICMLPPIAYESGAVLPM